MIQARALSAYSALALFIVSALYAAPVVRAATGLGIEPVKVSVTLNPGDDAEGSILLSNAGDSNIDVGVSVQDFIPVAGAETLQFVGRTEGVTSVRDWITVGTSSASTSPFMLAKGGSRRIPYRIEAPKDAEPGSHFGVIFFKATNPGDQSQIKVGTQVGVLVFVTIPGNFLQKGEIRSFSTAPLVFGSTVVFNLKFENTGTVYYEPHGEIRITNMLGDKVGAVPIDGQAVLPTGVKDMLFNWTPSGPLFGRYSAVATIKDPAGNLITSQSVSFWAAPVWYIAVFLAGALLLYLSLKLLRRYVRISLR